MAKARRTPKSDPYAQIASSRKGQSYVLRAMRGPRDVSRNVTSRKNPNTKQHTRHAVLASKQGVPMSELKTSRHQKAIQLQQSRKARHQTKMDAFKSKNKTRRAMKQTWYGVEGNTRWAKKKLGVDIKRTSRLTGREFKEARKAGAGVVKSTAKAAGVMGKRILKRHKGITALAVGTGIAAGVGLKKAHNKYRGE